MTLLDRLDAPGPKRILAIDGGGIRGALAAGYLVRIEALLRERHGRKDLVLADYFDLIGGTSTGAIIATGLAMGMSAADILARYQDLGGAAFKKVLIPFSARFNEQQLDEQLVKIVGDRLLGDAGLRTGLCIVAKRADSNSAWPLLNHPRGRYYPQNSQLKLHEAIRASSAAPTYFIPQTLDVGHGLKGAFVDGGVSMANNPSLLLFLIATLKGFPFHWPTGADRLMLTSIGTGWWCDSLPFDKAENANVLTWAQHVPGMLMEDANWLNQTMLQYLSRSPTAVRIDREMGDLSGDLLTPEPALTYLRYNAELETPALAAMGVDAKLAGRALDLRDMSEPANRFDLAALGEAVAGKQVDPAHFPAAFDLR